MEPECNLEENNTVKQAVVEEIIVPEHCLTIEKINRQLSKKDELKTKHKTKRCKSKCDDDDDDDDNALFADDDGSQNKDDEKTNDDNDEYDNDDKRRSEHDDKYNQDDDVVELEVVNNACDVKTAPPSNSFAASKNVAQGMMDIALITANANQLRYILAYTKGTSTYFMNVFLVSTSLTLQILVGMALIVKARYKKERHPKAIKRLTNFVVIGVFLITIINVFIASFTVTNENSKSSI